MNEYQHRRHNKSLLMAHIILVPKYRRAVFCGEKFLWSDGYFAATIGQVSQTTIKRYIENQG